MGTTTAALTASQRARKNCLIPSSGLDPADSSLHFCLVSGTCGRCVVGKTLCSFPVAARASGTYEGALRRFTSATGCQEPVNRNEFEWPPFATSYSPGYLLTGEESREWCGLNVSFRDDCKREPRPFPSTYEKFKDMYGNEVKINAKASPGPPFRANGILTNAEAVLLPLCQSRVKDLVEILSANVNRSQRKSTTTRCGTISKPTQSPRLYLEGISSISLGQRAESRGCSIRLQKRRKTPRQRNGPMRRYKPPTMGSG